MGWESVLGAHELLAVLESQAAKVAFDVLDRMESTSLYLCKSMRESMSQDLLAQSFPWSWVVGYPKREERVLDGQDSGFVVLILTRLLRLLHVHRVD